MQITFVGGGNMAAAIIGGLIRQNFDAGSLRVVEIVPELRARLAQRFGVATLAKVEEIPADNDLFVLAVKPQQMPIAARALASHLGHAVVLSIAAGIRITDLSRWLGGYSRLIRCMPNTPALIAAGITAAYATQDITPTDRECAERVLKAVGEVVWVDKERQLDAVTAVSGSGPAYVFYFIEALREAAVELGLSAEASAKLALQTFLGAGQLAAQSPEDIVTLRQRVTSPGGTTEAALKSMTESDIKGAIIRAVKSAERRSVELGAELGKG